MKAYAADPVSTSVVQSLIWLLIGHIFNQQYGCVSQCPV